MDEVKTYVNGESISISGPTRLRHGDILSLGIRGLREAAGWVKWENEKRRRKRLHPDISEEDLDDPWDIYEDEEPEAEVELENPFAIFRFSEVPRNSLGTKKKVRPFPENDPLFDAAHAALSNHLILSNLFRYFPLYKLKPLRLVSQLWSDVAKKEIWKRSLVKFVLYTNCKSFGDPLPLLRFRNELSEHGFTHPHWKFVLRPDTYEYSDEHHQPLCRQEALVQLTHAKNISDLEWFFGKHKYSMTRLDLDIEQDNDANTEILEKILTLSAPTLLDLGLNLDIGLGFQDFPQGDLPFLKNVRLDLHHYRDFKIEVEEMQQFLFSLFLHFRNAAGMDFTLDKRCKPLIIPILQEMLDYEYPNLSRISFSGMNEISTEGLKLLIKLPQKSLKALKLDCTGNTEILNTLLERQAGSLVDLNLVLNSPDDRELTFPGMPNLKKLNLSLGRWMEKGGKLWFSAGVAMEEVNYPAHFPSLQSLHLRGRTGESKAFWDKYFPVFFPSSTPDQVCKTLVDLNISPEVGQRRKVRLANMFPRVEAEFLREARLQEQAAKKEIKMKKKSLRKSLGIGGGRL